MDSWSNTPKQGKASDRGQNIKVFVRVRPLNENERRERGYSVVHTAGNREVNVRDKSFTFDKVFGVDSKQLDVYKSVVAPLVGQVLQGYNCTVFAYGQTGTGKTHTMEGPPDENVPDSELGIIPRALNDIFDNLRIGGDTVESFVRVSFVELYNEEIFDLLSGHNDQTRLRLFDDPHKKGSVIIKELNDIRVIDKREVYKILKKGSEKRRTAETKMNAHSSRSHTIFTVTVYIYERSGDGDEVCKIGKLNLVDLAGSENIGRSGAADKQAREAGNINQSLLTLGRVITSLVVGGTQHVPYRESKLTRLLQDSLGGKTKTSIIATVSPASSNLDLTLSTLEYASRAKKITNKPEINLKISNKEKIMEYQSKIDRLQAELQAVRDKEGAVYLPRELYQEQNQRLESQEEEIRSITKELKQIEAQRDEYMTLMDELKVQLALKETRLGETENKLQCVRTVLHQTEMEKQEQIYLVNRHAATEGQLREQAEALLAVSDQATEHREKLHDKLECKKMLEDHNQQMTTAFRKDVKSGNHEMTSLIKQQLADQTASCSKLTQQLDDALTKRADENNQIKVEYKALVTQLVKTIGDINSVACGNAKREQAWSDMMIKAIKTSSDLQSQEFSKYFAEQLVVGCTEVFETVKNLRQNFNDLSSSIDNSLATREKCLQSYLRGEEQHDKEDFHFVSGCVNNLEHSNAAIVDCANNDKSTADLFEQKSEVLKTQCMSLLQTVTQMQEEFLSASRLSSTRALSETEKMADSLNQLQMRTTRAISRASSSSANLRSTMEAEQDRFSSEKAAQLDEAAKLSQNVENVVQQLRQESEKFVNQGKDAWMCLHAETEAELLQNKMTASEHRNHVQKLVQSMDEAATATKGKIDGLLQRHTLGDKKHVEDVHKQIASSLQVTNSFGNSIIDRLNQAESKFEQFFEHDLKQYVSSGHTPARVKSVYPSELVTGTPDEERVRRFRQLRAQPMEAASRLDMDSINEEDDIDSVISMSTNMTDATRHSESRPISRQNSLLKTSSSNLSEAESEVGYASDKENSDFAKPRSKIRAPKSYKRDTSGSRASSRKEALLPTQNI